MGAALTRCSPELHPCIITTKENSVSKHYAGLNGLRTANGESPVRYLQLIGLSAWAKCCTLNVRIQCGTRETESRPRQVISRVDM